MTQAVIDRLNYHGTNRYGLWLGSDRLVEQRLSTIRRYLDFKGKTVLDLGCSGGYFSLNLAGSAKYVLGIDGDGAVIEQNILAAQRRDLKNIEFHHAILTPELIEALPEFDIVLLMSVFHHMLAASEAYGWNTEATKSEAFSTLRAIHRKAQILVFEMGYPDEGYDWSAKLPRMEPNPVSWIKTHIFGDAYDIRLIAPPALEGMLGQMRRKALEYRQSKGIIPRVLRRILSVDVRDQRHLFIGTKRK